VDEHGLAEAVGGAFLFLGITTIVCVLIWQLAASWRTRAVLARDRESRVATERALQLQEPLQNHLKELDRRITDLQSAVESLHRLLAEIE
jgi:hypothetical protein